MRALRRTAVLVAAVAACAGPRVTMLGPRRPARPAGCPVEIIAGTPARPFVDLAWTRATCMETARGDCLADLRRQACELGGDLVYGLADATDQHVRYVSATLASRDRTAAGAPAPAGGAAEPGACSPICSPGFDCRAGRCVPVCNPACGPSEICNNHRVCEPTPPVSPGQGG